MKVTPRHLAAIVVLANFTAAGALAVELSDEQQKLSYTFGMEIGNWLKSQNLDVDLEAFTAGVSDVYREQATQLSSEEAAAVRAAFVQRRQQEAQAEQQALAERNKSEGQTFLDSNKKESDVITTDSGLQYKIIKQGEGAKPGPTDKVTVHYRGRLLNGQEFDSSYSRNEPVTFALNQVIAGWTEGLQLMAEGGQFEFYIPSDLAYGERGSPGSPIGPNATLIFEVELIKVEAPAQ